MELQRTRRRRDELGHEPLCDVSDLRVRRETDLGSSRLEMPLRGARIAPHHPSGLRERLLEDVAKDEDAKVGAPQGVAANEVAEAGAEQATRRDRVADDGRRLAVELADPQERGDLAVRQMTGLPKRR